MAVFLLVVFKKLSFFDFFFNSGSFAGTFSEVVQFSSSNVTASNNLNFFQTRRVNREYSFNTNTLESFSYSDGFANAWASLFNDDTFESLSSLFVAFDDSNKNFNCISRIQFRKIVIFNVFFS